MLPEVGGFDAAPLAFDCGEDAYPPVPGIPEGSGAKLPVAGRDPEADMTTGGSGKASPKAD
jgi:hypothetical protein